MTRIRKDGGIEDVTEDRALIRQPLPSVAKGSAQIPVGEASAAVGMSRERLIRRIKSGVIAGGRGPSGWFVERAALARLIAERDAKQ